MITSAYFVSHKEFPMHRISDADLTIKALICHLGWEELCFVALYINCKFCYVKLCIFIYWFWDKLFSNKSKDSEYQHIKEGHRQAKTFNFCKIKQVKYKVLKK